MDSACKRCVGRKKVKKAMNRLAQHDSSGSTFFRCLSYPHGALQFRRDVAAKYMRILAMLLLLSAMNRVDGQTPNISTSSQENLRQVTTHPLNDLAPRLSPDGKWMLISSQRTGNYDIWLRNMETGFLRQLTKHRADQFYPVWDKKQRYIIYVSQESDGQGDLFRLDLRKSRGDLLPRGKPERITFYMGFDGYPTVSPDGEQIAWVSERSGRPEIWLQSRRGRHVRQLTQNGATHPAWSPKQDFIAFTSFRQEGGNGDIWLLNVPITPDFYEESSPFDSLQLDMRRITTGPFADGFPTWTTDAQQIIFTRYDLDTNHDGLLSPTDHAVLWAVDVSPLTKEEKDEENPSFELFRDSFEKHNVASARPLTPAYLSAQHPEYSADNKTYFVSSIKGNADIWSINGLDFYSVPTDTAQVLDFINNQFPLPYNLNSKQLDSLLQVKSILTQESQERLWQRITALHQIIAADTLGDLLNAAALYEIGMCYTLLNHADRAQLYFISIIDSFPAARNEAIWAELILQVFAALKENSSEEAVTDELINATLHLQQKYPDVLNFIAQSEIVLGGLFAKKNDVPHAEEHYSTVEKEYAQFPHYAAQSQYMLGELYDRTDNKAKATDIYLKLLQKYKKQAKWSTKAYKRLLSLAVEEAKNDTERIEKYLELHAKFNEINYSTIEPISRAARLLSENAKTDQALTLLDSLITDAALSAEDVFALRLQRIDILLQSGEYKTAVSSLIQLVDSYAEFYPHLSQKAIGRLVELLLVSAADSKQAQNFAGALTRYREILDLDPHRVEAHQGYVECMCKLGNLAQVIEEYTRLNETIPNNEVLRYGLALAYSFKATPDRNGVTFVRDINLKDLEYSNKILREALSFDYNLIQVYLTMSYNYEMMETYRQWRKNRPKNFWTKAGEAIVAPLVWAYQPIKNRHRGDVPRHYEHAIQVLTAGYILNDEKQHPDLEARVALNMANNYYNLGEFGFNKAYEFYHLRMHYDSTFVNDEQEAVIKEQMGHCAFVADDLKRGANYLKRAIELYERLNRPDKVLINIKRLALLYEFSEDNQKALIYYQQAAELERQRHLYDGLLRSYRSIAYQHFLLNNQTEAVFYANQALALLDDGRVQRSQGKPIRPQFGILGIYFPIPYDLRKIGAKSVLYFSTDEEEAILYTILAATFQKERQFDKALALYEKKLAIYEQRHDYDAQAIFQNNIAYLYFVMGDYDNAWQWFVNSYGMCNKTKNINGQMINIANAAHLVSTAAETTDETKNAVTADRHAWVIEKINSLLEATRDADNLYAQNRVHLYMALADLLQLDFNAAKEENLAARVQHNLSTIRQAARADTLLNRALLIAHRYKLRFEENTICLKRGHGYLVLGDAEKALEQFIACRKAAVQLKNADILWRANTAIGNILIILKRDNPAKYASLRQPLYYFLQAIEVSEKNRKTIPGLSAGRLRQHIEEPYRAAIKILIEQGATERALNLAEHMRERNYLDFLGDSHLWLGDGKRQELYSIVDSLEQEINELELSLLQTDQQLGQSPENAEDIQLQLFDMRDEYALALEDVRREAPEIESLIRIAPVNIQHLQKLLPDSLAVIYQIADIHHCYLWTITKDSLLFQSLLFDSSGYELAEKIKSAFLAANALPVNRIVFIPDYDLLLAPWSRILQQQAPTAKPLSTVCSSLTGLANALRNSRPIGNTFYYAASRHNEQAFELDNAVIFHPTPQQTGNAFLAQRSSLSRADIIHLEARVNWDIFAPLFSHISFDILESQPAGFLVKDFYGLKGNAASHVTLQIEISDTATISPEVVAALERALYFGDISSVLLVLHAGQDTTTDFYRHFYEKLSARTVDRAFAEALADTVSSSQITNAQPRFLLFGFGGMDGQQRDDMLLSIDNLSSRAQAAFAGREWLKALQLYSRIQASGQNDHVEDIQTRLFECAVNAGLWEQAIQYLEAMANRHMRLNQWARVADAYRLLLVIYEYQKDEQNARKARATYERIVREYGLDADVAYAWQHIADLSSSAGNVHRAVDFYGPAASEYKKQKNPKNQALMLHKVGNLYAFELGDIAGALMYYDRSFAALGSLQSAEQLAALEFDKGCAYFEYNLLHQARLCAQNALRRSYERQDQLTINRGELLLAQITFAAGDCKGALDHLNNMQPPLSPALEMDVLLLKSRIFAEQNYLIESENMAKQCLKIANRVHDQQRESKLQIHLAALYVYQKKYSEALPVIEDALAQINGDNLDEIQIRLLSAAFLLDIGEKDRALQQLQILQEKTVQQHDSAARAHCYYLLSHAESDSSRAYAFAKRATVLADSLMLLSISWRACWRLAQLEQSRSASLHSLQEGLKKLLLSYPTTKFSDYSAGLVASEYQFVYDYADSLVEANEYDVALDIVEKVHRRLVRRAHPLYNREAFTTRPAVLQPDSLQERFIMAQSELVATKNQATSQFDSTKFASIRRELETLLSESQQSIERDRFSIDVRAQAASLPPDIDILRFFHTEKKFYVWHVSRGNVELHTRRFDPDLFDRQLDQLYTSLAAHESVEELSNELYQQFLSPVEKFIKSPALMIIPFGKLYYLPFSLLAPRQAAPIGLEKRLSHALSLRDAMNLPAQARISAHQPAAALVSSPGENELTRNIAQSLSRYYQEVTVMTENDTASQNVQYAALYIGGRIELNPRFPFDYRMMLPHRTEEWRIPLQDYLADNSSRVVVFHSGQISARTFYTGREYAGFFADVLEKDAQVLLSGQWIADELSAAVLIKRFFRYLSEGESWEEALRRAQKTVHDRIDSHPSAWAGYRLTVTF